MTKVLFQKSPTSPLRSHLRSANAVRLASTLAVLTVLCLPLLAEIVCHIDFENNDGSASRWAPSDSDNDLGLSWKMVYDSSTSNHAYRAERNSNRETAAYLQDVSLPSSWTISMDLEWEAPVGLDDPNGGIFGLRLSRQSEGIPGPPFINIVIERKSLPDGDPAVAALLTASDSSAPAHSEPLPGRTSHYRLIVTRLPDTDRLTVTLTDDLGGRVVLEGFDIPALGELTVPALYAYGVTVKFDNFEISAPSDFPKESQP